MKQRALFTLVVAGLAWSTAATCLATPITEVHLFGTEDLLCVSENTACAPEVLPGGPASIENGSDGFPHNFTNTFNGGYRSGGYTAWDFFFNPSAFTSITSMTLDVDVVGFIYLSGNINPLNGQVGNYLAIDGLPFAAIDPPLDNLDGLNRYTFVIPNLDPGAHQFSVWAYEPAEGEQGQPCFQPDGCNGVGYKYEGWGGVDFAKLTIEGDFQTLRNEEVPAAVPEPASLVLLGSGLLGLARFRRRSLQRSL